MTRYRYFTATTLDGYLADDHDSLDWLFVQEGDPDHGPGDHGHFDTFLAGVGALVMGATTYQWVVDHLREAGEGWPYALPTFVFTHRDLDPAADTVRLVAGAPTDHREALETAAGDRDVWVVGGGGLAADLAEAGMLDELVLSIAPVTLGSGRPLLPRPFDLRLRELTRNGAFAVATYDVVGPRAGGAPAPAP